MGKFSKDKRVLRNLYYSKRDIYYRKAKEEGYRARSAYKLLQIEDQFKIFSNVKRVIDLCAAPGSWSQVVSQHLAKQGIIGNEEDIRVIAIDLQEIAPIEGVNIMQGDITRQQTVLDILKLFQGNKAELVVCDGAPDVTGFHEIDQYVQSQLLLSALKISSQVLAPSGCFVAKIFRGRDISFLYAQLKTFFKEVFCAKPKSSRNSSYESFVVCKGFMAEEKEVLIQHLSTLGASSSIQTENIKEISKEETKEEEYKDEEFKKGGMEEEENREKEHIKTVDGVVRFVSCGDLNGFDADKNYPLELGKDYKYVYHQPAQMPINPPYEEAKAKLTKNSK